VKLCFEFLTVFRRIAGRQSVCLELGKRPAGPATVTDALLALEEALELKDHRLLHAGRTAAGVLIFRRTPTGALKRIRNPEDQAILDGDKLVLSVAMDGG
jgi:hypothetical protein